MLLLPILTKSVDLVLNGRNNFWLRSVVSSTNFANCNNNGNANNNGASNANYVRPITYTRLKYESQVLERIKSKEVSTDPKRENETG